MIDLLTKKKLMRMRVWWGGYLRKQFQWLECDCMISCSTIRLAESDLDYAVIASKVRTELSCPT